MVVHSIAMALGFQTCMTSESAESSAESLEVVAAIFLKVWNVKEIMPTSYMKYILMLGSMAQKQGTQRGLFPPSETPDWPGAAGSIRGYPLWQEGVQQWLHSKARATVNEVLFWNKAITWTQTVKICEDCGILSLGLLVHSNDGSHWSFPTYILPDMWDSL